MKSGLIVFLSTYLHAQGLHTLPPEKFFARNQALPRPDAALSLELMPQNEAQKKHAAESDFLDWILREKLAVPDADGHRVVPPHLANPFPKRPIKLHGKLANLSFSHVLLLDPKQEDWRSLAAEWLKNQKSNVHRRRAAVNTFLIRYIHGQNLERNYGRFLLRETWPPRKQPIGQGLALDPLHPRVARDAGRRMQLPRLDMGAAGIGGWE